MSKKPLTVVTGGASGIGAACVRHHVKRGDTVIVLDLPNEHYERIFETLVRWGRFGNLLGYDDATGHLTAGAGLSS